MTLDTPQVSIGLPVFNGATFVREAIDSIINQSFTNLELIISDNGSTDGTDKICKEYCNRDPRVRFYRNEENRGAGWNYNRVFELARGKYFKWAAHDDYYDLNFLQKSLEILENDTGAILCHSRIIDIDEKGLPICRKQSNCDTTTIEPHIRFKSLIRMDYTCEEVFGVIRSDVLRRTVLISNYSDSDRVLLAELGIHGRFHEIPEYLLYHRVHQNSSVAEYADRRSRVQWFDPNAHTDWVFPYWRQLLEYIRAIQRTRSSFHTKRHCYRHMVGWMVCYRGLLRNDVAWCGRLLVRLLLTGSTKRSTGLGRFLKYLRKT